MRYVFIGCFFPDGIYADIVKSSKGSVQNAADALQKSFIEGLSDILPDFLVLNYPRIGWFPKYSNISRFSGYDEPIVTYKGKSIQCHCPSYINVFLSSRFSIKKSIEKEIQLELQENDQLCVIIYAISPWTMEACHYLKNKYGEKLSLVLIVPDLPEYMGERTHWYQNVLLKRRLRKYQRIYTSFSGFIFLTEYMAEKIPVVNKPWTVVEGIFNFKDDKCAVLQSKKTKNIFYSGTLDRRYGIINLVKAFMQLKQKDIRLVLCGKGNTEEEIERLSSLDPRIEYLGQLPREAVLKHQKEACLLVNPRTFEGEYTKFSFPSKTMEYMASGVPTLIYNLPGIPSEYYDYCFCVKELGIEELTKSINNILLMDEERLHQLGIAARDFIFSNKNPYQQCQKVYENVLLPLLQ